jgi:PAS domain S-box-containing protein
MPLKFPVSCYSRGEEAYDSVTENLTSRGMCLKTNGHFQVGTPGRFIVSFPNHKTIEVGGEVRWKDIASAPGRMGVQFSGDFDPALPLSALHGVVRQSLDEADAYINHLCQNLGDACVWVNPQGVVVEHDDRFLKLFGYAVKEVDGRPLSDFVCPEDQEPLSHLLNSGVSAPTRILFRMEPKQGPALLCRIRVSLTPPWKSCRAVYIDHMVEFGALFQDTAKLRKLYTENVGDMLTLKDEKEQINRIVGAIKHFTSDRVVFLSADLSIVDIGGVPGALGDEDALVSFRGMNLREATGLVEIRINEKSLWEELQLSVKTGREFLVDHCHYPGRVAKTPDLFPEGVYRIRISPVSDSTGKAAILLMFVTAEARMGEGGRRRFQDILAATATNFVLQDVLKGVCNPLTCLLARLELVRYKFALDQINSRWGSEHESRHYSGEIGKIEAVVEALAKRFRDVLENSYSSEPQKPYSLDANESCMMAINAAGLKEQTIKFSLQHRLSNIKSPPQETVMILIIFLLLSRECLRTVTDKTIQCETKEEQAHIVIALRHKGYVQQDKYLEILFDPDPVESYFFKRHSMYWMDTLLYYANSLAKKNSMKVKINNVPGEFALSLYIPCKKPTD